MLQIIGASRLGSLINLVAAPGSLNAAIMAQPLWLQAWIGWMVAINVLGGLLFFRRAEAK